MDTDDLSNVMTRIARGDKKAFELFYDSSAARLYGFIVAFVGSGKAAEDILQETFWKVWKSATDYDPNRSAPISWAFQIARSTMIDHVRKMSREGGTISFAPNESLNENPGRSTAEGYSELNVSSLLNELPDDQREVIDLSFLRGLTHPEIASLKNIPLGTVKTRIRSGMLRLREKLDEYNKAQRT